MRLPFAAEGLPFVLPPAAAGAILPWAGAPWNWIGFSLLLLAVGILLFFRDPERAIPDEAGVAVSPADGRVIYAGPVADTDDAPKGASSVVAIFLSVLDVHVNRSPASGTIEEISYRPGRYLAAFLPEASRRNERNEVRLRTDSGIMTFRQIAGVVARRIVCRVKKGDRLERGERVGLIRFGSRTELFLDADWELSVAEGDRVRGGESILARRRGGPSS